MYEIKLQQHTVKRNQVTAIHLIAAFLLIVIGFITLVTPFSMNIYNAGKDNVTEMPYTWVNYIGILFMIIGISIIVISIFFNKKIIQQRRNLAIRIIEIICFGGILVYTIIQQWTLPAVYAGVTLIGIIAAYYLENAHMKQSYVHIATDQVSLHTGVKQTNWKWSEIERLMLKHNVLTIDLLNQKRYQFITADGSTQPAQLIMDFANEAITKAIPDRIKDNW